MRSLFPPLWRGGAARAPTHFFSGMSVCPAQEPGARPRAILNFEQVQPLVMRVLIVEDDNALADGLMRTLRQSGYAVDHAESGELARRASIGPDLLDLAPREWAVLEYLLMRVGQVVSKEHMLQAMCSWDDSLAHNAIEVYISRLRSKLQDAGIRIRTVRGFGYMVEDPDER